MPRDSRCQRQRRRGACCMLMIGALFSLLMIFADAAMRRFSCYAPATAARLPDKLRWPSGCVIRHYAAI